MLLYVLISYIKNYLKHINFFNIINGMVQSFRFIALTSAYRYFLRTLRSLLLRRTGKIFFFFCIITLNKNNMNYVY